jgi:cellulose synthase/poly-beta-1,6-N-acetylglucosamine synthase-like glycosyltransferase
MIECKNLYDFYQFCENLVIQLLTELLSLQHKWQQAGIATVKTDIRSIDADLSLRNVKKGGQSLSFSFFRAKFMFKPNLLPLYKIAILILYCILVFALVPLTFSTTGRDHKLLVLLL